MRVRFTAPFDWDPPEMHGRVTIFKPAGFEGSVRRQHGEDAVAAGKAVSLETDHGEASGGRAAPRSSRRRGSD